MLSTDEFIDNLILAVYRTAIDGTTRLIDNPPGRSPRSDLAELSGWFHSLSPESRERLREVVRLSVDQAVFGFLAVLDGARAISSPPVSLMLTADDQDLNAAHDLHERFRAAVDEAENRES
jgi:hypothetical protein